MNDLSSSTAVEKIEMLKSEQELKLSDMSDLPPPETPTVPMKRFGKVSDGDLRKYEDSHQSKSTKKNTSWGLRLFQDWNKETYGEDMDTYNVSEENLATALCRFYCEARPKQNKDQQQTELYHKNTLKNIRGALNRHLQDIGRSIDIVRDKAFKQANKILDGLLKDRVKTGTSRPTSHKEIISNNDLKKISTYLSGFATSLIILRQAVWFNLSTHFVCRGLEWHHQLRTDSFQFKRDEHGEYVTITHETQQKKIQGGLNREEAPTDKRMYATGAEHCPVQLLRLMIHKTDPTAEKLFNQYRHEAVINPKENIWYTRKPLAQRTFSSLFADLCKNANLDKKNIPRTVYVPQP